MGKGEIARHEQFLLFPQCFQKARFPGASKGVILWEWVNQCKTTLLNPLLHMTISGSFNSAANKDVNMDKWVYSYLTE